ncbi:MAG TPA: hypothetical protein VK124_09125 [Gemmatimonadales bacterium]|nr:hypothetical protein [Gemmatimonadales bacterium]
MDVLNPIIGLVEKVFSGFRQAARADLRITDQALLLRRQLAASFEEWPQGPKTDNELRTWGHRAAQGFSVTQPGIDGLVGLRVEASRHVRRAIGRARDDYYLAADLIAPAITTLSALKYGQAPPLRKAFAHFKRCIEALDVVASKRD